LGIIRDESDQCTGNPFLRSNPRKSNFPFIKRNIPRKKIKKSSLPHACKFFKSIYDFQTEHFTFKNFIPKTEKNGSLIFPPAVGRVIFFAFLGL